MKSLSLQRVVYGGAGLVMLAMAGQEVVKVGFQAGPAFAAGLGALLLYQAVMGKT